MEVTECRHWILSWKIEFITYFQFLDTCIVHIQCDGDKMFCVLIKMKRCTCRAIKIRKNGIRMIRGFLCILSKEDAQYSNPMCINCFGFDAFLYFKCKRWLETRTQIPGHKPYDLYDRCTWILHIEILYFSIVWLRKGLD